MDRSEAKWRAQQLVARMTVSEKMTQLRYDSPAIERLGVPAYKRQAFRRRSAWARHLMRR